MSVKENNLLACIDEIDTLAEFFHQMSDSTRLKLLTTLFEGEKCVCELAEKANVSVSAVSHQLRSLRTARLVRSRREGKHVYYNLDDDHVREIVSKGIEHIRE